MRGILSIFAFVLVFSGCSITHQPKKSTSYLITIISPRLKLSDFCFLHNTANNIELQIYSIGSNIAKIKVSDKTCINNICFKNVDFNKKFFLQNHYEEFFKEVLLKKPIYSGRNLIKNSCGFNQNLKNNSIQYTVCHQNMKFIDLKNEIKITLKEIK